MGARVGEGREGEEDGVGEESCDESADEEDQGDDVVALVASAPVADVRG